MPVYNRGMSDLTSQVVKNTRQLSAQMSQRKHCIVRVCGEEHIGEGSGQAQIWLTLDNDMAYIAEMKFKLVFGNPGAGNTTPTGSDFVRGTNTYPTFQSWVSKYPVGSAIDTDGAWGAQCWDYANAFWLAQVNRRLETGPNHTAAECWTYSRTVNAGSDFDLITDWNQIKKGDWIVWTGGAYGHIGMAYSDGPNGSGLIDVYAQNQGGLAWPTGGAAISSMQYARVQGSLTFAGAFRYKKWHS